jgi:Fe-S cluster assembly iron-binding protein IscA
MKITDRAKTLLMEAFASSENDCLKARLQKSCCGTSVYFTLTKLHDDDVPITINGIPVLMDRLTQERAKTVTLNAKHGRLVIEDEASSGCC